MIEVPFKFTGQGGEHKSKQYTSELTQNMYLDFSKSAAKQGAHDFPGLKAWGTGQGADRGVHKMAGVTYSLQGNTLYSTNASGTLTAISGTVSGLDRAIFADDGTNLYFTANSSLYKYNGSTVATVSQSVISSPSWIAYINKQFILGGAGQSYAVSDVSDGDTYQALNSQDAEVLPDGLTRGYVFNQLVYMLGEISTETHYNSGVGSPPFDRQENSLVNVGIAGKHAVTNTDNYMYWLGDDRKVYQVVGASKRAVSDSNTANQFDKIASFSDCIASSFVLENQNFVMFVFPSGNKTLLYSETFDYWVTLTSGTDFPGNRWYGNSVISCYDKNLVIDYRNGNIYELDKETYTDNSDARLRIRDLPSFTGKLIKKSGGRVTVGKVRLNMQVGVGLSTGQGVAPVLMFQFSPDGGQTWQAERHISIGEMGNYIVAVDFDDFATGYEVKCRVKCSDPVLMSIFDGVVEMEEAGY